MAKEATLKLGKNTYNVLALDYMLYKPYDNNLKPSAVTQGGLINFTIKSPKKGDLTFHDWMNSVCDVRDGEFILPVMEGIDFLKKQMSFTKAHCVCLQECYSLANKGNIGQTGSNPGIFQSLGGLSPIPFGGLAGSILDEGLSHVPILNNFLDFFKGGGGGGSSTAVEMYMKLTISAASITFDGAVKFRNKALP
jgi:hypothetical protein